MIALETKDNGQTLEALLGTFAQRDPIVEYKREDFRMFQMMHELINQEVAETVYRVQPVTQTLQMKSVFSSITQKLIHNEFSSLASGPGPQIVPRDSSERPIQNQAAPQPYHKEGPKVGRNDPCPCGSGKKYKKCCGK